MKIIKNSDIKFKLNSKIVYVDDFDMTFYTVNKENFFLKKSSSDVVEEDGYFWLNLAWEDLEYLGRGVMNYDCTNNYNDPAFPDDEYNYFLTKATDYFIDTFEVTPSDGKSINEKIDELQEGLSAETTVRSEADTALSGAIESEISARTSADEVLSGAISGFNTEIAAVRADLDNEVSARTQADEALEQAISNEVSARTEADAALSGAIDSEISARTEAITALSGAIDNEVSARTQADEALEQAISNEVSARTEADAALSGAIDSEVSARTQAISDEASARTSADNALSGAIDTEVSARTQAVSDEASARTEADATLQSNIDTETSARTAADEALSGAVDTALLSYFNGAEYVSSAKTINFKHDSTVLATIDATDFIKDGMVENVVISGGSLVITFNTDSGKEAITIALTDIFDPSNYYDKTAVDNAISAATSGKADSTVTDAISGVVSAHTANTDVHVSSGDKATWNAKQDTLVAGENITISGNVISAAGGEADDHFDSASTNPVENRVVTDAVIAPAKDYWVSNGSSQSLSREYVDGIVLKYKVIPYPDDLPLEATLPDNFSIGIAIANDPWGGYVWPTIQVTSFSGKSASVDNDNVHLDWDEDGLIISVINPWSITRINCYTVGYRILTNSFSYSGGTVVDEAEKIIDEIGNVKKFADKAVKNVYLYANGIGNVSIAIDKFNGERTESNFTNYLGYGLACKNGKIVSDLNIPLGYSAWNNVPIEMYSSSVSIPKWYNVVRLTIKDWSQLYSASFGIGMGNGNSSMSSYVTLNGDNVDYVHDYFTSVTFENEVLTMVLGEIWGQEMYITYVENFDLYNKVSAVEYYGEVKEDILDYAQDLNSGLTTVSGDVSAHTANTDVHVSSGDKATWNAKQDTLVAGENITISGNVISAAGGDLSNYYTKSEVDTEISAATSGKADTTAVTEAITEAVSGKANSSDVYTKAETSGATEISTALSGKLDTTAYTPTDLSNYYTKSETSGKTELDTAFSGKQDTLVAGENITISGNVISAAGGDLSNYYTKSEVDEMSEVAAQGINDLNANKLDVTAYTPADLSQYWTSAQTQSAITQSVSGKQDTLTAGTGIDITSNVISVTGGGGGGAAAVEVTQAEYDALVSGGTVDPDTFYIITDAASADVVQTTGTSSGSVMSQSAVTSALSGKQDTLTAGSGITISGNVISAEGGGSSYTAGTNISIDANNGINCTLPITIDGEKSIVMPNNANNTVRGSYNFVGGRYSNITNYQGGADPDYAFCYGRYNNVYTESETAFGKFNIARRDATVGGTSATTIFTVGNGSSSNNRHNAFEIRQNGDIYITSGGTDIKLQDNLGGGSSINVVQTTGTSTTDVMSQDAVTTALSGKLDSTAYTPTDLSEYYTSAQTESAITAAVSGKADTNAVTEAISAATSGKADASAVTAVQDSLSGYTTTGDTNALSGTVTAHTADTDLHVTSGDKATWNAKLDSSAISDMATQTWVGQQGYLTEHQSLSAYSTTVEMNSAINSATSGKADSADLAGYATTATTSAISGAVSAHTADTTVHVTSSDKSTWSAKQDALVSGTNIKTINGASILGSGNITVNLNIWSGSAADYAQISPKDPNTLYLVV